MKKLNKFWTKTKTKSIKEFTKFNSKVNYSKDRRPHKVKNAHFMINEFFDYYTQKEFHHFSDVLNGLIKQERYLKIMYNYDLKTDKDFRTGFETYGYENDKYIRNQLSYISGRWNCSFRIKWLLDLIEIKRVVNSS